MFNNILAGLFILSASTSNPSCVIGITADRGIQPIYTIAEKKEEPRDPGKDITDDPHGPGTHGRDPHDEIHDDDLPANKPDPYLDPK